MVVLQIFAFGPLRSSGDGETGELLGFCSLITTLYQIIIIFWHLTTHQFRVFLHVIHICQIYFLYLN